MIYDRDNEDGLDGVESCRLVLDENDDHVGAELGHSAIRLDDGGRRR